MMCGGTTQARDAAGQKDIQDLCDKFRKEAEEKTKKTFALYAAIKYKTQVVAGTNYFVKIQVDGDEHIHVRIFQPLPCNTDQSSELVAIQTDKSLDDELEYF